MSEASDAACACGTCASCGSSGAAERAAVGDARHFRHSALRQRMLDSIAASRIDRRRPLVGLTTRASDDPAIALIDAQAAAMHVLAWNSGQLAKDGSILSGEDRAALVELTRLIGYRPRPALSATTTLAFTLDTLPGAPATVRLSKGSKVASMPGQDELPQMFETDAELEAHGAWNALRPVGPTLGVAADSRSLFAVGVASAAKVGDLIGAPLSADAGDHGQWRIGRIRSIERVSDPAIDGAPYTRFRLTQRRTVTGSADARQAYVGRIVILGQSAAPFGATAPDIRAMTDDIQKKLGEPRSEKAPVAWRGHVVGAPGASGNRTIDLDAVYPAAMVGRVCLLTPPASGGAGGPVETLTMIHDVAETVRTDFLLSAKISRIELEQVDLDPESKASLRPLVRSLAIAIETEVLTLHRPAVDIALPTSADTLDLVGYVPLPPGRRVVLSGQSWMGSADVEGPVIAEVATVLETTRVDGNSRVRFERPVSARFRSTTLRLLGNCIGASHGETPASGAEIIGSGDAARRTQSFTLKGKPLAHVPAETARGYAPAIEVRVGGRAYREVDHLVGQKGDAQVFTLRTDGEGVATMQFAGSLPSGLHNVTALYRTGGGRDGNLAAGRISMALAPVAGISALTNPVAADGGSDAEMIDALRRAAPQSVRTLDRVVSLSDYEAFAAGFRGVGKALATELFIGMRAMVCLTIADSTLGSPDPTSDIVTGLADAMRRVAVPGRALTVQGFDLLRPAIGLAIASDPAFRRGDVEVAVRAALAAAFGADVRSFGRGLHRSEILAAVQAVGGVAAVQVTQFTLGAGHPAESEGRLLCPAPSIDPVTRAVRQAGLLVVDPALVQITELVP